MARRRTGDSRYEPRAELRSTGGMPGRSRKNPGVLGRGSTARRTRRFSVCSTSCMGYDNAIIPNELLHPTGVFKERLSQSVLVAAMRTVTDDEAKAVRGGWMRKE